MKTEYDPVFAATDGEEDAPGRPGTEDLDEVKRRFAAASRPFFSTPWSWVAWAVLLPLAALATPLAYAVRAESGVLLLWSLAIFAGGLAELFTVGRKGLFRRAPAIAGWAFRQQSNLSIAALVLSAGLLFAGDARLLPALWLLLLGHSLWGLGSLAFRPMAHAGLIFQAAGLAALWPTVPPLVALAAGTGVGCAWMALGVWRSTRFSPES